MKMLTKEIEKRLPLPYSTQGQEDPIVQVKYFCPWNQWTWFGVEYDPESKLFYGYVIGEENELGYFSLTELESIEGPFGLKIERDILFQPKKLSEVMK